MAILGEIRKKTWLLIVVIGIAMVAFLAGDLFSENSMLRKAIAGDPNTMGSINGENISIGEYNQTQQLISNLAQNQGQSLSPNQINEQVWSTLLRQKITLAHADKLGIKVSDNEFWEYVATSFGFESPEAAKQQLSIIENQAAKGDPQATEQYRTWKSSEEQIRQDILTQKYISFVASATGATSKEAEFQQISNIQSAEIDYAFVSYADLEKKHKVEISDDEILAYEKKYEKRFEAEDLIKMSYVFFPSKASKEDENKILADISAYLSAHIQKDEANGIIDTISAFSQTKNDSAYVAKYSETPFVSHFFTKEELKELNFSPASMSFINSAAVGQVGGPFKESDSYQLLKLSKSKLITDSVKTSHILIGYAGSAVGQGNPNIKRNREQAKAVADSLLKTANSGAIPFNQLATKNSDDLGSSAVGGDIGWIERNNQSIAPSYLNYATTHSVGSIGLIESQFGFHIIKIDNVKSKMAYQIANIVKRVSASKTTTDKSFKDARTFVQNSAAKSLNDFVNLARKDGFNYNTTDFLNRFSRVSFEFGHDQDEAILKWAFNKNTKVGDNNLFTTNDGDYIVAYVSDKFKKGLANPKVVRTMVEPILKHEKLVAFVDETIKGKGLAAFTAAFNTEAKAITVNFANPTIEVGYEPRVVGAAFGLKPNTSSKAIQGNTGVFVVKTKVISPTPKVEKPDFLLNQLNSQQKQRVNNELLPSLIEAATIKDNRFKVL